MDTQDHGTNKLLNDLRSKYSPLIASKSENDVTFVCSDGKEVPAHSIIVAINSPVFKDLLNNPKADPKNRKIQLQNINEETLTEILRFIYTREVKNIDTLAQKLLYASIEYKLALLEEMCTSHMMKNLNIDNAIDYFVIAHRCKLKDLLTQSMSFIDL